MVLLKTLKKHINQFVVPDIKPIADEEINFYPNHSPNIDKTPSLKKIENPIQSCSFQETYEKSYSHGLENIYAIETIDLKTVKPLSSPIQQPTKKAEFSIQKKYLIEKPLQLEFNFGGKFRTQIDSFLLSEPIYHLDLSMNCLKALQEQGSFYIRDLIGVDFNALKLNHASIEEIKKKLELKIGDKQLTDCKYIDFNSWVKSLIPEDNRIKFYLLLEKYKLEYLISLTALMNIELKRLKQEEMHQYIKDAIEQLFSLDRVELVKSYKKLIVEIFLIPWLRERHGIAEEYEIYDFIEQLSENISEARLCIDFLSNLYSNGVFLFQDALTYNGKHLYFSDNFIKNAFQMVENRALTYFTHEKDLYELGELSYWIKKEFAVKWVGFCEGFVEKVLKKSSLFYVYKNNQQKILIALK